MAEFAFRAFLSHRYKSPEVNLFFFRIFAQVAQIQFEVDEGLPALNVTRLERMVRDADAFVGIYPFPTEPGPPPSIEELRRQSRYFRLELDLAIRSGKPTIVFYDDRYGPLMKMPAGITVISFDARELLGSVSKYKIMTWKKIFRDFCSRVRGLLKLEGSGYAAGKASGRVGLLLPPHNSSFGYTSDHRSIVESLIGETYECRPLPWPPTLDPALFGEIRQLDWTVLDVGPRCALTGAPAYLHGQFMPMMRLYQIASDAAKQEPSPLEETLYGGVEVGYRKDIVRWHDKETLRDELKQRLAALNWPRDLITTVDKAENYFTGAALRNEDVFLSYSGEDEEKALFLYRALKRRFNSVFNYRAPDGSPIPAGEQWNTVVYEQLGKRTVGILLLSEDYNVSDHCRHEAAIMMQRRDSRKARMRVFPIKLYPGKFAFPPEIVGVQHLRWYEYDSPDALVDEIARQLDQPAT